MSKSPTIAELAHRAGVGVETVCQHSPIACTARSSPTYSVEVEVG
jgi:hypothetical protein